MSPKHLWKETPLIYSSRLSEVTGASVYLKLENLHPSHSFKYRGISHFIKKAKEESGPSVHLVIASGGNAGLAAACAARVLGLKCSVFIPEGVAQSTLDLLRTEKAEVIVGGRFYAEALRAARDLVAKEPEAVMVPAYDNPVVWEGHSSMIHEVNEQLQAKPDAIFCSVGGGGLLGGILVGCKAVGWDDVTIGTLETHGSDCFYRSMSMNGGRFNSVAKSLPEGVHLVHNQEHDVHLAHFTSFSSQASGSLGASEPAAGVVKMALERTGKVKTVTVPDELSMQSLLSFADDHKLLVELACATTLVAVYHRTLFDKIIDLTPGEERQSPPIVVFVVCGGFKVDLRTAAEYKMQVEQALSETWRVEYDDGQILKLEK